MLLFEGFLWHDEFFVAEALVFFGDRYVVTILRALVLKGVITVYLPLLPIIMFGCWFDRGFLVFGVIWSIIVFGAGIVIFGVGIVVFLSAQFRAAPLMMTLWWCLRRIILD